MFKYYYYCNFLFQLPLWLKQELADSEAVNDGNEADVTSGEDSSAIASKTSLSSIQINKHLKQGLAITLHMITFYSTALLRKKTCRAKQFSL